MKRNLSTSHIRFILSAIFVLALLVRVICFVGLIGSDDLNYNRAAYLLTTDAAVSHEDHQTSRLGLLLPVAQAFKLWGVNEISSILFPFLCFTLLYWTLVVTVARFFGPWIGIMAGVLYTFLPIEIFHATMLLPDLPSAAFLAVSGSLLYWDHRHPAGQTPKKRAILLFLAGVLFGWAYLIRVTAVFFGVFVAGYFGWQTYKRRAFQWAWLWFGAGVLLVLGLESGYYYWITHNPFYRYQAIGPGIKSPVVLARRQLEGMALLKRLSSDLFALLLLEITDYSFYYFFVFAGILYAILQKRLAAIGYFIGWFVTILLCFNFASRRLSEYIPLRLVPRYYVTLSVPAVIILAWYLYQMKDFLQTDDSATLRAYRLSLGIPFVLVLVLNVFRFSVITSLFLGGIALLLLLTWSPKSRAWLRSQLAPHYLPLLLPCLLLYVNFVPGIYMAALGERPRKGITCERNIRPVLEFPLTHTIYTDQRTEEILEYFYHYQYDDHIQAFPEGQQTCTDTQTWHNAYVVANWERLFFLNRVYHVPIPDFLFHPCPTWKPVAQLGGEVNPCLIYAVP